MDLFFGIAMYLGVGASPGQPPRIPKARGFIPGIAMGSSRTMKLRIAWASGSTLPTIRLMTVFTATILSTIWAVPPSMVAPKASQGPARAPLGLAGLASTVRKDPQIISSITMSFIKCVAQQAGIPLGNAFNFGGRAAQG